MPKSSENSEPFDPLYSLRDAIISKQEGGENSETLLKYSSLITTDVTETLALAKEN